LQHFAGDSDGEFWLRRSAFKALCAAQMAPKQMMKAWIAGTAMEPWKLMDFFWVGGWG
jgi:hypothetical protein